MKAKLGNKKKDMGTIIRKTRGKDTGAIYLYTEDGFRIAFDQDEAEDVRQYLNRRADGVALTDLF